MQRASFIPAMLVGFALTVPVTAQRSKLTAGDATFGAEFGVSVALSGDTAIVGAWGDGAAGVVSGAAYVFVRNGTSWSEQQKLIPSDAAAGDFFGYSVALDGDTAVVGSYLDDDAGSASGAAYVFVRSGTTWSQQQKLTASDSATGDQFGISVALSEDTALVGSWGDDDAGAVSGSAYVFVRSGTSWSQQQKLTGTDTTAGDLFGYSVALSGGTAVVGAYLDDDAGGSSGSAYVFVRSGANWNQQQKLTASDAAVSDFFGASVGLSGDTAVVGAWGHNNSGSVSGSAYVFTRSGSSWSQQQELTAGDGATGDLFGYSVALSGDTAVVGAHLDKDGPGSVGSAYVFVRSGASWSQQQKLNANDSAVGDQFGISAAVSGETSLVGANWDNTAGGFSGSAYVYNRSPGSFSTFGFGCAGTVGVPALDAQTGTVPWIRNVFELRFSGMPTGGQNVPIGVLGFSKTTWGQIPLPLDLSQFGVWGCILHVSPDVSFPLVNLGGTASWKINLPNNPSFIGVAIYVQGAVLDSGVNPAGLILTNAGQGIVGGW